ncbi:MAG: 2-amino-4-hydroxy-6-hydroxymethyldihydropteridine diphosphokinase [Rhodospirillaceae bacterium]|nr:2-amino-4-hydroxy-6-hydroxymethyldihydropteridine diphosphokinase [Rhodospirillaceae bacterium]
MILIGVGANLPSAAGSPRQTCEAALAHLGRLGVVIAARSPWYETAPVPVSDQPWFVNGVARVETRLSPAGLLAALHLTEAAFGRLRTVTNGARTLDLDLLAYRDETRTSGAPLLPHPRLHERAFVLFPLRDLAPAWRHPVLGETAENLAARLPEQGIRRAPV